MAAKRNPERDERVRIPLEPETALRALLAVDPADEPAGDKDAPAGDGAHKDEKRSAE